MTTAERRAREKAERRRVILDAAREVFFENGIHRATVDAVAARAEVSKGTIYLYFTSKESILAHLLLESLSILGEHLGEAAVSSRSLPPEERIRKLAWAYLHFAQDHPNRFRLLMAMDRGRFQEQVPEDLYEEILAQSTSNLKLVAQVIEQGIEQGAFAPGDPWQTAGVLWAALNGVVTLMANPLRQRMLSVELGPMLEATLDLLLRGLKAR